MRSLRRLLGLETEPSTESRETETLRRISAQLDELGADEARYLAAFAYVLTRVAHADRDVSEEEILEMERLVRECSSLTEPQSALVVEMAKRQTITLGGTENYVVTRQFRDMSTRDQRLELVRCLFAVAAADQNVSEAENAEISIIANEIGLTTNEVAACRAEFRQFLAVLKNFPGKD